MSRQIGVGSERRRHRLKLGLQGGAMKRAAY
jgi:hypothetical protein